MALLPPDVTSTTEEGFPAVVVCSVTITIRVSPASMFVTAGVVQVSTSTQVVATAFPVVMPSGARPELDPGGELPDSARADTAKPIAPESTTEAATSSSTTANLHPDRGMQVYSNVDFLLKNPSWFSLEKRSGSITALPLIPGERVAIDG